MQWIKNVFQLFYPNLCYGCDAPLLKQENVLCEDCLFALNFIPKPIGNDTEMKRRFYGKLLTEYCLATFYYSENEIVQKLLHNLKYKKQKSISEFIGVLTLQSLQHHDLFNWANCIVPIPLHSSKERKRGYNQLDGFAMYLSKELNIPYYKDFLIKKKKTSTQTHKNIIDRAYKEQNFHINPKYKNINTTNILLIDDVMTTGSTLEMAGNCILKNSPHKISILTMAYTR